MASATPASRSALLRKTFVMQLRGAEHIASYVKNHDEIWPELRDTLKSHGASNYSISLHPTTFQLFAYVELESVERWDAIANTAVCRRWWAHMEPLMDTVDGKPAATELKEVFFLP